MKLQDLLDKRAKLIKEMRALLDGAPDGFSAEQEQKYNRMDEEVTKLDTQIKALQRVEDLEAQLTKPTTEPLTPGAEPSASSNVDEAYKAFFDYVKGESPDKWMAAMTTLAGEDGGYVVPVEYQRRVLKKLHELSHTRSISNVIQTANDRLIPVEGETPAFGWIDEGGNYDDTLKSTFGQTKFGAWKLGGIILVSEELLKDSMIDLEAYLATQIAIGIDKAEAPAFATGDGNKKPAGYANGLAGKTLASKDGITGDEIIDTFYALKSSYRSNATWRVNDATMKAIRKLKDGNGNYIYAPALVMGERDMILGRPIVPDDYLPALGETSKPVLVLGDFGYYTIADRGGLEIKRLDERYADKGMIGFRVTKRVDAKRTFDEAFVAAVTPSA